MKQVRYSQQREIIKEGLKDYCVHPTAEELYIQLKKENPKLSLATVYRNLNMLSEINEIKKIEGLSDQIRYDHNTNEHFHLICLQCQKVEDLPQEMSVSIKKVLENQNDFEVKSYDILVKGLCKECKEKGH